MDVDEFLAKFQPRCFYHFTDSRNLLSIREHGILRTAELRRRGIRIPAPGGNELSQELDVRKGLDEFIHLCLRDRHPMEYVARQEGRLQNPRYLRVRPEVLHLGDVRFSAEVSNKNGARLLSIEEAAEEMDFEVLCTWQDWRDPEIQRRLQIAEKYELLVPQDIPVALIEGI